MGSIETLPNGDQVLRNAQNEVRGHYTHAIDITPTVLDLIGLSPPADVDGVAQLGFDGASFAAGLRVPSAPEHRTTQFYEQYASRAIYHDGWKAVAYHSLGGPANYGAADPAAELDDAVWELYRVVDDFSESRNVTADNPRVLRQLQDLWWAEAARHQALPLQTGRVIKGERPSPHRSDRTRYVYRRGDAPIPMALAPELVNRSHVISADITVPASGADGVIVAHGGRFGGYALYIQHGSLRWRHNRVGVEYFEAISATPLAPGRHRVGVEFVASGWFEGDATLFVDGESVGTVRAPRMVRHTYSLVGDDFCVGFDSASPVGDYDSPFPFEGEIHHLVVDVSGAAHRDLDLELERIWRTQ